MIEAQTRIAALGAAAAIVRFPLFPAIQADRSDGWVPPPLPVLAGVLSAWQFYSTSLTLGIPSIGGGVDVGSNAGGILIAIAWGGFAFWPGATIFLFGRRDLTPAQ